jgi:predicted transcriptional regulator
MSDTTLALTAQIVSAHIANNTVRADQLPTLIRDVHRTLSTVGEAPSKPTQAEPAVEVKKSVFADHLVCLACGGSLKTLKWHLMSDHELTPEQYRSRFGLPREYPMVSPAYSKVRSAISK